MPQTVLSCDNITAQAVIYHCHITSALPSFDKIITVVNNTGNTESQAEKRDQIHHSIDRLQQNDSRVQASVAVTISVNQYIDTLYLTPVF